MITITDFSNGWGFDAAWNVPPQYYKDAGGRVHLNGLIRRFGQPGNGEVAFTMPEGFRPAHDGHFAVDANLQHGMVKVQAAGIVQIHSPMGLWVSLDGISYLAAP